MQNTIKEEIQKTQALLTLVLQNTALHQMTETVARECLRALRQQGKIMFVGNGGSAADAQHLAAELVSRLRYDRPGLVMITRTKLFFRVRWKP
jgi:D-sedoheptulose 7-phosphate isomerase